MGNFTINALSSQGSQRSLDKAGRVLENSELHCSALLTSCSRLLKLTIRICGPRWFTVPQLIGFNVLTCAGFAYVFGTTQRLVDGSADCQFQKTTALVQKTTALTHHTGAPVSSIHPAELRVQPPYRTASVIEKSSIYQ